jgi:molybdopterin-dependent oxidoreductase alpha subunit
MSDLPRIEPPPERAPPTIDAPKEKAAGLPGVYHALKDAYREMGVTRSLATLARLNQRGGFDCPSCAWPDPDDRRSLAEFCENGAKAVADEATRKLVDPSFFARHSLAALAEWSDHDLGRAGRFTHPLVKRPGATHYEPIAWDDAFQLIGRELRGLSSPNEASFYTSGRTSNEAAFLYQLFAREFGTNNLPDCSNMCHESSGFGLNQVVGVGKGTVTLEDIHDTDLLLIIGQNPGTCHPRMLSALQVAVRKGAKLVAINPLREAGLVGFMNPQEVGGMLGFATPLASLHLPVRVNGDVALLKGIMKYLVERGAVDRDFVARHTTGFEAFAADLRAADWTELERESGIPRERMRETADLVAGAKSMIVCWAMGITQHKNGVANVQSIANLLLLGGHFGRRGAGACPVRGHSNVQGDRTVGIWEKMPESFLAALGKEFGFEPPRAHGFDTVNTIRAMRDGRVKAFIGMGGNFLAATPDTEGVAEGLRRCRLTVHVSTKPNRSHLVTGETALVLPCLARSERDVQRAGEQFVTVENSMGVIRSSRGKLAPASEHLRSEVAVIAGIARATLPVSRVPWGDLADDYSRIRARIERVVPGFDRYEERVRDGGEFYLPNAVRDDRTFRTADGKAHFTVHAVAKTRLARDRYLLTTLRTHDQFNTTVYGLDDRYRGIRHGRRVILMNEDDMKERGFREGDPLDVTSHFRGETRTARRFVAVPYQIPRGCLAAYYPEANPLVPLDHVADGSNQPAYKSVEVSLDRAEP